MSIKVIREQTIGFDESGLSEVKDDLYIKLESDLAEWLRKLKGVRLSTFIFISLSEAYICAGIDRPATLHTIADGTGYTERAVLYAVQWLQENEFITEGQPAGKGAKTYRPKAYAWFGKHRGVKKVHSPENFIPLKSVVVGTPSLESENISRQGEEQQQTTRRIFQGAGVVGASLDRLKDVSPETAQAWADWIAAPPLGVKNPQGIAVAALFSDPDALPPNTKPKPRKRDPHFQGEFIERMKGKTR